VADFACQAVIAYHLTREFPKDRIIGEEDSSALRANPTLANKVLAAIQFGMKESNDALSLSADKVSMYFLQV
jgi:3'-phosphoadenosine 5'-phosphosulfate (PAPS) 3'-phosphatase